MSRPTPTPPGPGQESAWDYPRPPLVEPSPREVVVEWAGRVIAATRSAVRVCETSHPPAWAIPPDAVDMSIVHPASGTSLCEWKGVARYWDLAVGDLHQPRAGWSYPDPTPGYEPIAGHLFFYAGLVDRCTVDGEVVTPQPGSFYGGWITGDVVGPFKGQPGSAWW